MDVGLETLHYLDDFLVICEGGRPASTSIQLALNCCSEVGASNHNYLFGDRTGHGGEDAALARGETEAFATAGDGVEGEEMLHEEGVAVTDWATPACYVCGEARKVIPKENNCIASGSEEAAPQNPIKLRVQIGPSLVGYFPVRLERQKYDEVRVQEQL